MHNSAEHSPSSPRPSSHPLATVLLALALFAGLWFGAQWLAQPAQAGADTPAGGPGAAAWPTVPPTVTPQPASTSVAMPTPIPLPRWEEQRELIVGTFTISTVQEAEVLAGRTLSLDKTAWIRLTYEVQMTVDLAQIDEGSVQREGNTISVTIPPPVWKKPVYVNIASLESEHHSRLFPNGPPEGVIGKGVKDIVDQLEANPGLRQLAYDAARSQVTELLKGFGFRQVTVTIK